ncbi:hypothetical protein EZV62_012288 [Acer yangbiense]|uniref:Uncharacterized protein n=1 Tax=Acer yangbiense TaxID=1000413 RepID=A0A5C7HVV4_9ROSI|nr:hypothetical protein EZV62_012288 [Acer yangbiense]
MDVEFPVEPTIKHFKSWPLLMYESTPRLPHVSPGENKSSKEVIMVDPLEAKRLAAKQFQDIKAKEKFKRRRQIEAINGAWAMIGLTAGLVIEGQTGKSILAQMAGYFSAITAFFMR